MPAINTAEIVTVRSEKTTMTRQQVPNFAGVSGVFEREL